MKTMNNAALNGIDVDAMRNAEITLTESRYNRTASGKNWKNVPYETRKLTISAQFYYNCVDAMPFFRNLGGTERATKSYTRYGYIPVTLTSVSPDRQSKTVREFQFA